ncbi:16734_t:CDS:2, partial [Dentiscutata heterogama]
PQFKIAIIGAISRYLEKNLKKKEMFPDGDKPYKTFEIDSDNDNDNYDSVSIYSEQTTRSTGSITSQSTNVSQISNPNKIMHYLAHTPTYKEQAQFEKDILNITIENSWFFRWLDSKSISMINDNKHAQHEEEWDKPDSDELGLDENAIILNQIVVNVETDHSSINKDAKWNLCSLFGQNLPTPPYFSELQ